jgi:hypothetical protein
MDSRAASYAGPGFNVGFSVSYEPGGTLFELIDAKIIEAMRRSGGRFAHNQYQRKCLR